MAAGVGKEGKGSDILIKTHRFLWKTPGKEKQRKKDILAFSCGDGLPRDHAAERLDGRVRARARTRAAAAAPRPPRRGLHSRRLTNSTLLAPPRSWSVLELKAFAGWLGLTLGGKKQELQDRIAAFTQGGGAKKKKKKGTASAPTSAAKKPRRGEGAGGEEEDDENEEEDEEEDEDAEEGGRGKPAKDEEAEDDDEEDEEEEEEGEAEEGSAASSSSSSSSASASASASAKQAAASATDAALGELRSTLVSALPHLRGKPQRVVGGLVDAAWATFSATDKRDARKAAAAASASAEMA